MTPSSGTDVESTAFAARANMTPAEPRAMLATLLAGAMEAILVVMVVASPWANGAVEENAQFLLFLGLSSLLVLWAVRMFIQGTIGLPRCSVAVGLAVLFILGLCQLLPLPRAWMHAISPNTAALYDRLLPLHPEQFTSGEGSEVAGVCAGSTLSLYPFASRMELLRLLAVVVLFVVVRSNWKSTSAWRRLAWAVVANGALLSLFGLVQHFTSDASTIYWTQHTDSGQVFGPFVCRDHFAFYINLSMGFGLGVLLAGTTASGRKEADAKAMLQSPGVLWIVLALAFMLGAALASLSRGGLVGLAGGALVCVLVAVRCRRRPVRLWPFVLMALVTVGLLGWFGFGRLPAQVRSLWNGQALQGQRLPIWKNALPILWHFPLCGTGYGTYRYAELLYTHNPMDVRIPSVHAHNEYLEALAEGGPLRLGVALIIIGLVLRQGYRAFRHQAGLDASLALGGLFAFSALTIHSIGDFALRIPAISVLAVPVAAQLCFLGSQVSRSPGQPPIRRSDDQKHEDLRPARVNWLSLILGSTLALTLGIVLIGQSWNDFQTQSLIASADQTSGRTATETLAHRIDFLAAASSLQPDNGQLQLELGRAYQAAFLNAMKTTLRPAWAAEVVLICANPWPGPCSAPFAVDRQWVEQQAIPDRQNAVTRCPQIAATYLIPALRHFAMARDRCPLLPEPQWRLAEYAGILVRGDAASTYLKRAMEVRPGDPDLFYKCGLIAWRAGDEARACNAWRRSLELSTDYLETVLLRIGERPHPQDLWSKALPDNPDVLVAAAALAPISDQPTARADILKRALGVLDQRTDSPSADDLHRAAVVHNALHQSDAAIETIRQALKREPRRVAWRIELAQWLYATDRLDDARQETMFVLALAPSDPQARSLMRSITRDMRRPKARP